MREERPGAITPWKAINRLLGHEERFCVNEKQGFYHLLAPKEASRLAAVLFALQEEKIPYAIEEASGCPCVLSTRSLNRVLAIDLAHQSVSVEAGCFLSDLESKLYEFKLETGLVDWPWKRRRVRLADLINEGCLSGEKAGMIDPWERILEVRLTLANGGNLNLGGKSLVPKPGGGLPGPFFCRASADFEGVATSFRLRLSPVPEVRKRFCWKTGSLKEAMHLLESLQTLCQSWERLDTLQSGLGKSYVLAQLSGTREEMAAFDELPLPSGSDERGWDLLNHYFFSKNIRLSCIESPFKAVKNLQVQEYLWTFWTTAQACLLEEKIRSL